jgi:hypothetical protein
MEPDAQVETPEVDSADDQQQADGGAAEAPSYKGFKARVDELTKDKHERIREIEAARQREAELVATIARLSESRPAPQYAPEPRAPMPELDPDVKRAVDARIEAMVEARIAGIEKQYAGAANLAQASRFEQLAAGEDPRVVAKARELLPACTKAGWPLEHVFDFALGQVAKADRAGGQTQPRAQNGQFAGPQVMTQNGTPPAIAQRSGPPPLPANFDSLPIKKRLEILEKRGAGDKVL